MITTQLRTRYAFYSILLLFVYTSCDRTPARQTEAATLDLARIALDGQVTMSNGRGLDSITPEAIAINAVMTGQRGAFALLNEGRHLAIFIAPGGQAPGGATWFISATVNTSRVALVDTRRQLQLMGIDSAKIQTLQQMVSALKSNGFTELTCAATPTLIATLKLGIGYLRSIGGTLSDMLVVPSYMLTPEQLQPWIRDDWQPGVQ